MQGLATAVRVGPCQFLHQKWKKELTKGPLIMYSSTV